MYYLKYELSICVLTKCFTIYFLKYYTNFAYVFLLIASLEFKKKDLITNKFTVFNLIDLLRLLYVLLKKDVNVLFQFEILQFILIRWSLCASHLRHILYLYTFYLRVL